METTTVNIPFGWNAAAPLRAVTETDDAMSTVTVNDINGAPIMSYRLSTEDGMILARAMILQPGIVMVNLR